MEATEGELTLKKGCLLDILSPLPAGPQGGSAGQAAIPSLASRGQQTLDCAAWEGVCPAHLALLRAGAKEGHEESPGVVCLWHRQADSRVPPSCPWSSVCVCVRVRWGGQCPALWLHM